MVVSRLSLYLSTNNLKNPWQSAYKAAHSTESALLKVKNDINCNLAEGGCQALVLLDLSAAIDTIEHETLLHRLSTWSYF